MADFESRFFELTSTLGRQALDDRTSSDASSEDVFAQAEAQRGLVVLDGNCYTIAVAAPGSTQVVFNRKWKIQNKHRRGGQSQNRFQRLAEESRACHLKAVVEKMQRAFVGKDGRLLVKEIVLAGPGPSKDQLLEKLPRSLAQLVSATLTVAHAGRPGLYDLTRILGVEQTVGAAARAHCHEQEQEDESEELEDEDRSQESLAASGIHKFSEDELTKILNRESKWLKKQLEGDYCKQLNILIAEKLAQLQGEPGTDLRTVSVKDLRKRLSGPKETDEVEQMIFDTSLCVLQKLQDASALEVDLQGQRDEPKRRGRGKRTN